MNDIKMYSGREIQLVIKQGLFEYPLLSRKLLLDGVRSGDTQVR